MTVLILRTLLFKLNVTLTSVFNFTVLLSYRAIRVFLSTKVSIKATAEDDKMQQVQLVWCASESMLMVMDDPPAPLLACVLPYAEPIRDRGLTDAAT